MWYRILVAFCCFTVAVTESERSPAKVRIHHERSTQAELIASVEALGKTHQLKLKRTLLPSVPLQEIRHDDDGTVTIVDISGNEMRNYYEDEETGALLFMNNENTLEGMISDSVALHYENNEHTASEVNERTTTPFCGVSYNKQMVDLPKHNVSSRLQIESKAGPYVVEVLVVADSPLAISIGLSNLVAYMQVYWKMVDRRFKTVTGDSITIKLGEILYCPTTTCDGDVMGATDLHYADRNPTLEHFAKYLATQTFRFDVAHLMTKRDIFHFENGQRNTNYAGFAYVGAPCVVADGSAFNSGYSEDDGFYSGTFSTAHEIGHNLGAPHDGEESSTSCPVTGGYLMSTKLPGSRMFWFSPCSSIAMMNVCSRTSAGCLKTLNMPTTYVYPNTIAGNFISLNAQCQWLTKVSNAFADPAVSASAQCFRLRCKYVSGTTIKFRTSIYPALEGTQCSTGGFCKDGYCQTSWV